MIALDAVQLYDMGFGPRMVPVAPPGVPIAPGSSLKDKALGKAPGKLTLSGWVGVDLNDPKTRCPDYKTAALWRDEWHANVGLAAGEGLVVVDNDQGAEFSRFLHDAFQAVGVSPLRRYVQDPKHHRDAWLFQVRDFIGEPAILPNMDLRFRNGTRSAGVQLLSKGKQLVVSGVHRDTKAPYVLDRSLSFDELPVISEDQLKEFFEKFNVAIATQGWSSDTGPVSLVSRPNLQPGTIRNLIPAAQALTQEQIDSAIAGAAALLAHFPNREVPAGETPTKVDEWLNIQGNYSRVAYALAATLGPAAHTPQARNLFLEWAMGRPQEDDPDSIWASVLRQPLKYGGRGLIGIIRDRDALSPTPFPDPDPNDPAFKVLAPVPGSLWDTLKGDWAYLTSDLGWFLNVKTGMMRRPGPFSKWHASRRKELMKELGIKPKKGERQTIADIFCDQPGIMIFHDLLFAPGEDPELPGGVFNTWAPTIIQPQTVDPLRIAEWRDHVHYVLGKQEGDRFIQWCAFVAQHPKIKPNWHFLIMTRQGVGKDLMMRPVRVAVGKASQHADIAAFASNFNEALEAKLLIISEVGKHHNDAQTHRETQKLKEVLAAPPDMISINPKYKMKYFAKNRVAVTMFSNDSVPLMLERDQRRVHVVNRLHTKPKKPADYTKLADWLDANDGENAKLVASYLLALPIPDITIFSGMAPESADKTELEERNVDVGLQLLEEIIEEVRQAGNPTALLTTASLLAGTITGRGARVTPPQVSGWLRDMERAGRGVGRIRTDPKRPSVCGVVSYDGRTARLWSLSEKHPKDGRPWKDISNSDLLDIQNGKDVELPPLGSSNVTPFPATVDEKV